eukprot:7066704-Pyramimonas_sp.AAC.1
MRMLGPARAAQCPGSRGSARCPMCCAFRKQYWTPSAEAGAHQWTRTCYRKLALGTAMRTRESARALSAGVGLSAAIGIGVAKLQIPGKWQHRVVMRLITLGANSWIIIGSVYGVNS